MSCVSSSASPRRGCLGSSGRESSTQTEEDPGENPLQVGDQARASHPLCRVIRTVSRSKVRMRSMCGSFTSWNVLSRVDKLDQMIKWTNIGSAVVVSSLKSIHQSSSSFTRRVKQICVVSLLTLDKYWGLISYSQRCFCSACAGAWPTGSLTAVWPEVQHDPNHDPAACYASFPVS